MDRDTPPRPAGRSDLTAAVVAAVLSVGAFLGPNLAAPVTTAAHELGEAVHTNCLLPRS